MLKWTKRYTGTFFILSRFSLPSLVSATLFPAYSLGGLLFIALAALSAIAAASVFFFERNRQGDNSQKKRER